MVGDVKIYGANGEILPPSRRNATGLAGGGRAPYDAADVYGQHMESWRPSLWSPDGELNMYRDRIVARVRDMVRNDGWASGAVTRILDNAIGSNLRPVVKPDYRALAHYSGAAFDSAWADEFGRAVEACWRTWANDNSKYCDLSRAQKISQIFRLAFRHKLIDGDALAIMHWKPGRISPGRARYATCVQLVDPDRLSNPQQTFDTNILRGGVEIDEDTGETVAYHIRRAHVGDWFSAAKSMSWERVDRETSWGRPIVVHDFDMDRAGLHRGGAGVLAPVLQRLKMLAKYDATELDAAIINAIFGAYIESPYDPAMVEGALMSEGSELGWYQDERAHFHDDRKIMMGGARIPILFPGEKINAVKSERPASNFAAFEGAVLRNASAAIGLSAQQLSQDWSQTNYSSARAALLESWKTIGRRRDDFVSGFVSPVYGCFLEELMDVEDLPLPAGAPAFMDCRTAYSHCRWMGPGRGWVDPVAEKQGAVLGMDAGLSTLESECAEQGHDWEEVLDQRQKEIEAFKRRGIPVPVWANMQSATEAAKKPEAE